MAEKHFSFFCNSECEYFPCHKTDDRESFSFNCLFCYCPLYALGRRCGGLFKYTSNGVKDCSDCLFPHKRENYDAVLARYSDILNIVKQQDAPEQYNREKHMPEEI